MLTLTAQCDQARNIGGAPTKCGCTMSVEVAGQHVGDYVNTLESLVKAGWRLVDGAWHCPTCAANDTADLE